MCKGVPISANLAVAINLTGFPFATNFTRARRSVVCQLLTRFFENFSNTEIGTKKLRVFKFFHTLCSSE
jgi:hypothetical protein